jgi:hypothetical protein
VSLKCFCDWEISLTSIDDAVLSNVVWRCAEILPREKGYCDDTKAYYSVTFNTIVVCPRIFNVLSPYYHAYHNRLSSVRVEKLGDLISKEMERFLGAVLVHEFS